jgi:hypothetical protein
VRFDEGTEVERPPSTLPVPWRRKVPKKVERKRSMMSHGGFLSGKMDKKGKQWREGGHSSNSIFVNLSEITR